jgi:hypothetical protein
VMDFSNSCEHSSHKIFDPALALHCIDRAASDEGDQAPSQTQCADRWWTKTPSTSAIW